MQTSFSESLIESQWQAWQYLPEAEKINIAPYCPGGFVTKPLQQVANSEQQRFSFDQGTINSDQDITAIGNVSIFAPDINALAEQASYSESSQRGELSGNVIITLQDVLLGADQAKIDFSQNSSQLNDAEFVLAQQDMHGRAQTLSSAKNQDYIGKHVSFTRCAPNSLGWDIKASTLKIDHEAQVARIWNPRIRVAEVPLLYVPYLSFPLQNQARTGLLVPTFGTGYTQDYYLHLAPNYDATLGIEYNRDYGYLSHNEFRFLTNNHNGITNLSIELAETASSNENQVDEEKRWALSHKQSGLLIEQIGYDFSTRWVSDSRYDLDIVSGKNELIKTQTANLVLTAKPWQSDAKLGFNYQRPVSDRSEKIHTLDLTSSVKKSGHGVNLKYQFQQELADLETPASASDYKLLTVPDLQITPKSLSLVNEIKLGSQLRYSRFSRELPDQLINNLSDTQTGLNEQTHRSHLNLNLTRRWQTKQAYFQPKLEGFANHYRYENSLVDAQQPSIQQKAWRASFDQAITFSQTGERYQQTLTPRLYYAYSPLTEQKAKQLDSEAISDFNLFTASRFKSIDRVGDLSRLSTSLEYKLLKNGNKDAILTSNLTKGVKLKQERLTLEGVDDIDPNWQSEYSDWNLANTLTPNDTLQFKANSALDHDSLEINSFTASAHYQPSDRIFADFSLSKADDLDKLTFGAYFPIRQNIALIGFVETETNSGDKLFDWQNQQATQMLVGLDYDNCCWNARFAVLETSAAEDEEGDSLFLDNSNFEVKFEITLKGVGASAGNIEQTLNNLNFGYSGKLFNYR